MSKKTDLSAGRQALRAALRELEQTALQSRTRTEAIDAANRRLEQAGLAKLGPTTVGGWFEAGSPAKDFRSLWALVRVLLEWSGQPSPDTLTGPSRGQATARWMATEALWKTRWEQAKDTQPRTPAPVNAPLVTAYLTAARNAARQHPYPGVPGAPSLPALADVYVHQQTHARAADDQDSPSPGNAAMGGNQTGPVVPATEVFRENAATCVLLGGPGGGKSTLLRATLADSADSWLSGTTGKTIPVMVSASALTGTDSLPTALARTITGDLRQAGLLDELGADFFRHPPRAGVSWLVLVDGLDEIPDTDTRSTVLTMLANTAAAGTGLYRFVVATRPLPATELGALGQPVPRYELQPFSPDDLLTYATHWFRTLDDPGLHADAFLAGLERSRLEVLARTPLMASMLCQLYAADPARPLPDGRTGAYQSFIELIYEQNAHKNIKNTHDQAIRRLKDRHQIPRDNQAAEQAAEQVRDHLPELIDHLAHERVHGSTAFAVEIVASHLQASRPQKVKQHLWHSFLSDLLRPTGILAQRANDFDFLHQTLLEYHAARHATRDEQARSRLLHDLIASRRPADGRLALPTLDDSYLGFLLDGLLAPQDRIAAETTQYVKELTAHGRVEACQFLITQVNLRTNLPLRSTAAQLARFANDTTLDGYVRVRAAGALSRVDREAGTALLARFANDTTLDDRVRVQAAGDLAWVDREAGTALLARFANDTTLDGYVRVQAAGALAWVDREAGTALLARFANDTTLDGYVRVQAAGALSRVDQEAGTALLARFANDTTLDGYVRVQAAGALSRVDQEAGAALLARFANDTTLDGYVRVQAAGALSRVDREAGAALLARFANDTTLRGYVRVQAAGALAWVDREAGAALLARFANDTTLRGYIRVQAAGDLAWVDREAGAALLARLANDTTLDDRDRVHAAGDLARVDREAGAALLARLANDTTLDDRDRVHAAEDLARLDREAGAALLARLANDTTRRQRPHAGGRDSGVDNGSNGSEA
ncbi:NACHT domain-containing protein [Streptomyces cyslabdanicus]|uniref:NACHT domain-containing protein n=1 Tax=Streptomyces cyslabdanicus TaxID=1470456 RepID=UPI0040445CB0